MEGTVKDPAGAIVGVYSKAEGKPLKSGKFNEEDKAFDAAVAYADWKFVYGSGSLAAASSGIQGAGLPSALEPATEAPAIPLVPPTDTTSQREDPAREARRPGCEKQREKDNAACAATGPADMQNPGAIGCAASVAGRFAACLEGGSG
jgi:hypothetical protein